MSFLLLIERALLTVFSTAISAMFIYYSCQVLVAEGHPLRYALYSILSIVYGAAMLLAILRAWSSGGQAAARLARMITLSYLPVFIAGSVDLVMNTMIEETLLVYLGICLGVNWHGVRWIAGRDMHQREIS